MTFRMVTTIWFILGLSVNRVVYGEKCGDVFHDLPASCCPAKYVDVCCPFAKPCNASAATPTPSMMTSSPTQTSGGKPFCMEPQNSSACGAGFFLSKHSMKYEPCPDGFYCPQDQLCIIPCPKGAYCVKDKVVNATKKSPQLCRQSGKCCSPSQSIPIFDSQTASKYKPSSQFPVLQAIIAHTSPFKRSVQVDISVGREAWNLKTARSLTRKKSLQLDLRRNKCVPSVALQFLSICKKGSSAPVSTPIGVLIIIIILVVMWLLWYCFKHEEKCIECCKNCVTERLCAERRSREQNSAGNNTLDKFREEAKPKTQTITIRFQNLGFDFKKPPDPPILQGMSGQILPGEITAVMGPSGSGKTTFLNVLSGKAHGERCGSLFINNESVHDLGVKRNITGFVPQEDIMHRTLTVKEVLTYQANLRLPSSISKGEKKERVNEVLDLLNLTRVKDKKIGDEESRGISGGERKRVNIGMELVTDPTLLFLDEPTSGLDSTSSLMVVDALKAVAEEKKLTIVCVIHQPRYEIFSKFHKVLFLAPGQMVFLGSVPEAENFFKINQKPEKMNPADYYMDEISRADKLPELLEQYAAKNNAAAENTDCADGSRADQDKPMPSRWDQFITFLCREIRLQFRLSRSLLLDQFLVLVAGGILGALRMEAPLDDFFTLVTLSSLAIGLTAMLSALRCFGSTRAIFRRESEAGVNRLMYFVAVNVAQIPIIVITPVVYLSLLYSLIAPRAYFRFHYVATLGVQFACTGAGYCISFIFSPKNSQMASVTFALISSLVAGSSPTLCKMTENTLGPVIYSLSFSRWYLEALFEKEAIRYPEVMARYVHGLSTRNGYTLDNYSFCVVVLFFMGLVYRVLAFFFMPHIARDIWRNTRDCCTKISFLCL